MLPHRWNQYRCLHHQPWRIKLFTSFTFLITVNGNANSVKSFESPTTTSQSIDNHPFQNIICKVRFPKIIKINFTINVSLPDTALKNINKSNSRWWLMINYCKRTLEEWNNTIMQYKIIFKYCQKIWNNTLWMKEIIEVRMFIKIYTKSLQTSIVFYNLYWLIFNRLSTTKLIKKREIVILFIPSVRAKVIAVETLSGQK